MNDRPFSRPGSRQSSSAQTEERRGAKQRREKQQKNNTVVTPASIESHPWIFGGATTATRGEKSGGGSTVLLGRGREWEG
ncbi:hypothetical protein E2C01_095467 [Portunus trituberculatus]|uniref:Uncharacterized protein n=1 Tax=Portunus trituberculatus TaxID=210409 RepID=A0A5B7K4A3_PORTR|nr:hypothetical protein [Portunus trituberculatus]